MINKKLAFEDGSEMNLFISENLTKSLKLGAIYEFCRYLKFQSS